MSIAVNWRDTQQFLGHKLAIGVARRNFQPIKKRKLYTPAGFVINILINWTCGPVCPVDLGTKWTETHTQLNTPPGTKLHGMQNFVHTT